MKRNMKKTINQGRKIINQNARFDITLSEYDELLQESINNAKDPTTILFEGISAAFLAGVAIGFRIRSKG